MAIPTEALYLDVNADAAVHPNAWKAYVEASQFFGNPSSSHQAGRAAKSCLEDARSSVASSINAIPDSLIFTSGGTEADAFSPLWRRQSLAGGWPSSCYLLQY